MLRDIFKITQLGKRAFLMNAAEQRHCDRFCFNGGSCFECVRDPYGLAQCVGCLCPQHIWAGERCEFRVGHGGSKSQADINFILACLFASLVILCACVIIHLYFKDRKQRSDPFLIPLDQQLQMSLSK
ncbi:hypothetical protein TSMEX_011507 [Taenia solium]|eukprot:TsM_000907700 transcript=TsM_000907700 gene=TsM_000907700